MTNSLTSCHISALATGNSNVVYMTNRFFWLIDLLTEWSICWLTMTDLGRIWSPRTFGSTSKSSSPFRLRPSLSSCMDLFSSSWLLNSSSPLRPRRRRPIDRLLASDGLHRDLPSRSRPILRFDSSIKSLPALSSGMRCGLPALCSSTAITDKQTITSKY